MFVWWVYIIIIIKLGFRRPSAVKNGLRQIGPRTIGPQTIGPRRVGPRTAGPRTAGPQTVGPPDNWAPESWAPDSWARTVGPLTAGPQTDVGAQLSVFQLGFSHKNKDRIKNVELYTHFRNCALPPSGPDRAQRPKDNNLT